MTGSELTTTAPVTPAAREYALQWLGRLQHLATLSDHDREALHALLRPPAGGLALAPRASRTVWVATPDQQLEQV